MKKNEIDTNIYREVTDIEELQSLLYFLFGRLHKICEEHGITYNMYGGTMLGAVRHSGIIPWDDDVDISMPREDYERFIKTVREQYGDKYKIYVYPDKNYIYPFAKFCLKDTILLENYREPYNELSLYIDIFPMDGCACDKKESEKMFTRLKQLKHKRSICVYKAKRKGASAGKIKSMLLSVRSGFYRLGGYEKYLKKEVEISKRYKFSESDYVCCMAASWFEKGIVNKGDYLDRKLYKFGDSEFWGMKDYDSNLRNLYGDYMCPPPESQRISNHDYKLFINKKLTLEDL